MIKRLVFLSCMFLISVSPAYASEGFYSYRGHMMGSWGMGWMMIGFWALLLIGMILIIRWLLVMTREKSKEEKSYLDILKERFASGEIDIHEFEEKKKILIGN